MGNNFVTRLDSHQRYQTWGDLILAMNFFDKGDIIDNCDVKMSVILTRGVIEKRMSAMFDEEMFLSLRQRIINIKP